MSSNVLMLAAVAVVVVLVMQDSSPAAIPASAPPEANPNGGQQNSAPEDIFAALASLGRVAVTAANQFSTGKTTSAAR